MSTNTPTKTLTKFVHLYTWIAPERFWQAKSRDWYLWYALLFIILIFLSALTEQYFLILGLIALLFLLYAQAASPPGKQKFEITNRGLKAFDTLFLWKDIEHFWVSEKANNGIWDFFKSKKPTHRLVSFEMPKKNPPRLTLLIGEGDEETIVFTLLEHIPYADLNDVANDFLAKLIYGGYLPLQTYMPETESYEEDETYPDQEITHEEKEAKRQKQVEQLSHHDKA